MSMIKTSIYGLAAGLVLSLSAAQAFACTDAQEEAAGYAIAAAAKAELGDTASRQSDRLIKIAYCRASGDVVSVAFTYNYVSEEGAYGVDGEAEVVGGEVQNLELRRPDRVWASIDTYYTE